MAVAASKNAKTGNLSRSRPRTSIVWVKVVTSRRSLAQSTLPDEFHLI